MVRRVDAQVNYCLEGQLLVASPHWHHESYARAVCLVVHHSSQGAVGIFLNRCLSADMPALWQQLAGPQASMKKASINFGGPQSGPILAVHNRRELAEFTSADGVYFAAQIHHLQQLVASPASDSAVKIIVGQADWQPGELEQEFALGHWLPLPVSPQLVFAEESLMWAQAMRQIGNHLVVALSGSRRQPVDILAN